jgi:hypothetical protein
VASIISGNTAPERVYIMRNVLIATTAAATLFSSAAFTQQPSQHASCRPRDDRLSEARTLLNGVPPSTSLEIIPQEIRIWFRTNAAGVHIPPRLQSEYPTEMVIVLQHQYRNLMVTAESITVTVSFKGVWETVVIPFDTLITVLDQTAGIDIDLRRCG